MGSEKKMELKSFISMAKKFESWCLEWFKNPIDVGYTAEAARHYGRRLSSKEPGDI